MADYTISNVGFNVDTSSLDQATRKIDNLGKTTESSVNKTNASLKGTKVGMDDIGKAAGIARGGVAGLGGALSGVGAAGAAALGPIGLALLALAAAAAVAVGVFTTVSQQLKDLHQINDVAEDLGIAAVKFSEFAAAMEYGGVKVEDTTKLLKQFSANINNAVEDNKKLAGAFTDLGLNTRDLQSLNDPVEAFLISARKLSEIEDINKRNAVSIQLFGKKANEVLREVAQYENNLAEQNKLGNVATEERLALAARQDDAFNKLAATGESLKNSLLDAFGPTIVALIEGFASTMEFVAVMYKELSVFARAYMDAAQRSWSAIVKFIQPVIDKVLELRLYLIDLVEKFGNTRFASFIGLDEAAKAYAQAGKNITVSLGLDPNAERTAVALTQSNEQLTQANIDNTTNAELAAAAAKAKADADKKAADAAKLLAERQKALADSIEQVSRYARETATILRDANNKNLAIDVARDVSTFFLAEQGNAGGNIFAKIEGAAKPMIDVFNQLVGIVKSAGLNFSGVANSTLPGDIETNNLVTGSQFIQPAGFTLTPEKLNELSKNGQVTGDELEKVIADYIRNVQQRVAQQLTIGFVDANDEAAMAKNDAIGVLMDSINEQQEIYRDITNSGIKDADELSRLLDRRAQTQEVINTLTAAGVKLTKEEKELIEALVKAREDQARKNDDAIRKNTEQYEWLKEQAAGIGDTISNSILEALDTGRFSFKDFLYDIGEYLLQSNLKKLFASLFDTTSGGNGGWIQALANFIGGLFSGTTQANGGAWSNGVQMFANGGVVNGTTPFGMAGGRMGIMGEAGPEAIMPLVRGSNGKLGVSAHGGSGVQNIHTTITNNIVVQNTDNPARDDEEAARAFTSLANNIFDKRLNEQLRPGGVLNPTIQGYN